MRQRILPASTSISVILSTTNRKSSKKHRSRQIGNDDAHSSFLYLISLMKLVAEQLYEKLLHLSFSFFSRLFIFFWLEEAFLAVDHVQADSIARIK